MKRTRLVLLLVFGMLAALLPLSAAPVSAVLPGDLVINEIHADPDGTIAGDANGDGIRDSGDDEFVEIINDSGVAVDISGWTLEDVLNTPTLRHVFPSGTVVPDQCSVLVFGGGTPTGVFGGSIVQTASTGGVIMNNGGDGVTLRDGSATIIAEETYSAAEGGNNQSITRDPDVTGALPWVQHSVATGSSGALFSPGTRVDGSSFAGCPLLAGSGLASPSLVKPGEAILLTVAVTTLNAPPSTVLTVTGDLTNIGGSATQSFFDDGTNGDVTSGDSVFSFATTVGGATPSGATSLPVVMADNEGRFGSTVIALSVLDVLTIMEIQGSGLFSPFAGATVETSGIVTAIAPGSFSDDGWIQDPGGDGDSNTSDGIFVNDFPAGAAVGDLITIRGEVEDQQFAPALPRTRIDDTVLVSIDSTGNALPAPVELKDLPNESLPEGIGFWENLEGMLVSVEDATVVAPTTRFGEFAMLAPRDTRPNSGYFSSVDQILLRRIGNERVDYNPERILVDDNVLDTPDLRPGDMVHEAVGIVDYSFGMYKLQLRELDYAASPLPSFPVSTRNVSRSEPDEPVVITTYNVENLFDLKLDRTADIFGEIGFDPGSFWGPPNTQNNTLRRKGDVCEGRRLNGAFDPSAEWEGFGNNNFDDLGTHSVSCSTIEGLFISEYVEGSSNNKAVEIYNGTGAPVDLTAGEYAVQISFNGGSFVATIPLTGTVADGDVFVLADNDAGSAILAEADQTSTSSFFNGDDAVSLLKAGKDDASSTPTASELETQLTKLALSIEEELELPEIMVLQEVENEAIAQELGDRVNTAAGTHYVAASFETSDGRGIEVAFLYDDDRVDLLDLFQLSGPAVEAAFGPSSPSPGREPLYGLFEIEGEEVHIVGNHFKSKGGDDPIFSIPSSMGLPFVRVTETQRKLQAQVVRDFVDELFADDSKALIMVTGDLNDFQFAEQGEGPDHTVGILEGIGVEGKFKLTNLVDDEVKAERFSFVFDGNSQVLDHMLISQQLRKKLAGVDFLHFNAGFPAAVGSADSTTIHASDHDPLEGRFDFD